ncbi:LOB domain-containing protein 24-like [Abrus precatorius]|uniref:LOB domain-containing protein 24-like n=1 Tax=Abrus precatorius TaxID=3816 RepID=A0A8B8M7R6_ABRPR|nr:LOB domain-containing protein 24-like [Abrus precatorius]
MVSSRCAACKIQGRKCPSDCIFSPYFPLNDPQRYTSVHRIYGGSNVGKMLQCFSKFHPLSEHRQQTVLYDEAECRIQDPIYGCYGNISERVQQINSTESELAKIQSHISILKLQNPQLVNESNFDVLLHRAELDRFSLAAMQAKLLGLII